MWKNTNGLKFCHWKIHFLGVQSHFSPKVLSHRIFLSPNAPFKIWAVYPCFTRWHDVSLSPSGAQAWEFSGKSRNSCFLVKIYAFSFLFMMFWAFLTRFPVFFFFFLLKVLLMPGNKRGQKKKKKKRRRKWIDHFQEPFATRHDVLLSTSTPLLSHTKIDEGMIGLIDLSPFFNSLSLCQTHRRRNDLQCGGGGQIFWSKKWRISAGCRACATQGVSEGGCAPSDVGAFLKI